MQRTQSKWSYDSILTANQLSCLARFPYVSFIDGNSRFNNVSSETSCPLMVLLGLRTRHISLYCRIAHRRLGGLKLRRFKSQEKIVTILFILYSRSWTVAIFRLMPAKACKLRAEWSSLDCPFSTIRSLGLDNLCMHNFCYVL